jgi:hypothetical protein
MVVLAETVTAYCWSRKYWFHALGLEQYLDLIRRAIERRHRVTGDVELTGYDDDGLQIALDFRIKTTETNLARAYDAVRKVEAEIREVADQAVAKVGKQIAEITARVSGWGSESLRGLVNAVETAASTDDKGRALEELCSQLLSSVAGWTLTRWIRTETEEIDISVLNRSDEPRLSREPLFLWRVGTGRPNAERTNSFFSAKKLKTEAIDPA